MPLYKQTTRHCCLTLLVSLVTISTAWAAEFPYQAKISREQAAVRCGPGGSYYATANLPIGTAVEVYQHAAEGWCAIRPLPESFSLIPSTETRLADGASLAEVTGKKSVSWIGSNVSEPLQLLWQVQLGAGETVEITGIVRRDNLAGSEKVLWYKIRPPAGEFRYIHADDLTPLPADLGQPAEQVVSIETTAIQPVAHNEVPRTEQVQIQETAVAAAEPAQSQWRVRTNPKARLGEPDASQPIRIAERTDITPVSAASGAGRKPASSTTPRVAASSGDADTLFNELDVSLSLLAAQPMDQWDFSEFEQKMQQLDRLDLTTKQRTRKVRFGDRMSRFLELHEKQASLLASAPTSANAAEVNVTAPSPQLDLETTTTAPIGTGLAAVAPAPESEVPTNEVSLDDIPAEYDGMGILMPVISREQQAPPFALLDKKGNVLGFVSPVPGLNLRRYVKQEVGVVGQRGYLPKYQATHLTAQRIIVLDRHR